MIIYYYICLCVIQVEKQIEKSQQPVLNNIQILWKQHDHDAPQPLQVENAHWDFTVEDITVKFQGIALKLLEFQEGVAIFKAKTWTGNPGGIQLQKNRYPQHLEGGYNFSQKKKPVLSLISVEVLCKM